MRTNEEMAQEIRRVIRHMGDMSRHMWERYDLGVDDLSLLSELDKARAAFLEIEKDFEGKIAEEKERAK